MVVAIRSSKLLRLGLEAIGYNDRRQDRAQYSTNVRRFRSAFGAGPLAISVIFRDLQTTSIPEARIDRPIASHLLVAMNWLTVYDNEDNMAGTFRCCENTLRNRIWKYVNAIAALKDQKIVWDIDSDPETFLLSVDGVHFRIHEMRKNPDARWCSYKYKQAGLAYEIGLSIFHDKVVWIRGPFKAAEHDRDMYRSALQKKIPKGKLVVADRGYSMKEKVRTLSIRNTRDSESVKEFKRRVRGRHETFNARLKRFQVLNVNFRAKKNRVEKHKTVFEAVCVIVQYDMENGHPLFAV